MDELSFLMSGLGLLVGFLVVLPIWISINRIPNTTRMVTDEEWNELVKILENKNE